MLYQKRNKKAGNKIFIGEQKSNINPFMFGDHAYLEHLHKELKLRNARAGLLSLRNDMIQQINAQTFKMSMIELLMSYHARTYRLAPQSI